MEAVLTHAGDTELLARFRELRTLADDPKASSCPLCATINKPSWLSNAVTCTGCDLEYCADHGTAHAGRSCRAFTKAQASDLALNADFLRSQKVHSCPQCSAPIEKNGGCMHMTCSRCKFEFCWMCRLVWNKWHHNNPAAKHLLCPGSTHLWSSWVQPDEWTTTKLTAARVTTVVVFPTIGVPLALCGGALAVVLFLPACVGIKTHEWYKRKVRERERRERRERDIRAANQDGSYGLAGDAEAYRREHGVDRPAPPELEPAGGGEQMVVVFDPALLRQRAEEAADTALEPPVEEGIPPGLSDDSSDEEGLAVLFGTPPASPPAPAAEAEAAAPDSP